jgi:DNA-binding transcriptional ArsR family regulator
MIYPRFLLNMELNETAKLIYIVLLDRSRLSQINSGWTDGNGHVYLYYPIKSLADVIQKSEMTVKTALTSLETAGLIERKRRGTGLPNRIYVKYPIDGIISDRQTENYLPDRQKSISYTDRKLSTNKNKRIKTMEQVTRNYNCREDECL